MYSDDGRLLNASLLDYRMPTSLDVPMIDTVIVEVPNPYHPYGVRGVGEVPIVPPPAAIANAIYDAVGVRMDVLPMSPANVLRSVVETASGSQRSVDSVATVWIPPLLQRPDGRTNQTVRARRIRCARSSPGWRSAFRGSRGRLCEDGRIRPGMAVVVDSVVSTAGLRHRLTEASEVHFLPAISGG